MPPIPILLSWSGGKDSVLTLDRLRADARYRVVGLLTTITEGDRRAQMHRVPAELLERQAQALGLPISFCEVPASPSNAVYEARLHSALEPFRMRDVHTIAFGDLFLADIRAFREQLCQRLDVQAAFPLWDAETTQLAHDFVRSGYRAVTCCVDARVLPASFAGRDFDAEFLRELPAGIDPCGERGEFHTFVFDGPEFAFPVEHQRGAVVIDGSFWYCSIGLVESRESSAERQIENLASLAVDSRF